MLSMKRFLTKKWLGVLLAVFSVALIGGVVSAVTKDATYTLYWEDADKNALKTIFDDGEKQDEIGGKMVIVAKGIGGDLFDDKGAIFKFDSGVNKQLNEKSGDDISDNYYATIKVYCEGANQSLVAPTTKPYYIVDYTVGFYANDWNDVQNHATYKLQAGITKIKKIGAIGTADEETFAKGAETSTSYFDPSKLGDDGDHGGHGGDAIDHIPASCWNALSRGNLGNSKLRNWWKLPDGADKGAVKTIATSSTTPGGGGTTPGGGATGSNDIPCLGGALGWVLCPIINIMADGIRAIAAFIDSTMQFRLLADTSSSTSSGTVVRAYWANFVGLANIMLVIAFLVIIYSQATSAGLSNYGIKKMLPRIVIGAIMINISFYICALAIDISNIVGNATLGFLTGDSQGISAGLAKAAHLSGPGAFQTGFGTLLGAVIGVILLVLFLTPLLVGILITFVMLIGRQVILLALVLAAPLAIAAWLLPNTEEWFKKWRKTFIAMLVIYPEIMAVFGLSLFAAQFITQVAVADQSNASDLIAGDAVAQIASLVILAIPLLAMPVLLKGAHSAMNKLAGEADRFQKNFGIEGGLNKAQGGMKTRGKAYGRMGFEGAKGAGRIVGNSSLIQRIPGMNAGANPGRLRRAGSGVVGAVRGVRDFDQAAVGAAEARKKERERLRQERVAQLIGNQTGGVSGLAGAALRGTGGSGYEAAAIATIEDERRKRVSGHEAQLKEGDFSPQQLGDILEQAIRDGNRDQASAAINRLTLQGATGAEELALRLQGGRRYDEDGNVTGPAVAGIGPVADLAMRQTIDQAVTEHNFDALVGKSGDIAKGRFNDTTGAFEGNFHTLGTDQVEKMSEGAMRRYADQIDAARARVAAGTHSAADVRNITIAQGHFASIAAKPGGVSRASTPGAGTHLARLA